MPQEAKPATAADLIDQFEIDAREAEFDPELDAVGVPDKPAPKETRERNPDGTFKPTPKHTHSKVLAREALGMGFSQEDLDETPTEELRDIVNSKRVERLFQARNGEPQTPRDAATTQSGPSATPANAAASSAEDFDLGVDFSAYDSDFAVGIGKLVAEVNRLRKLESRFDALEQHQRTQAEAQTYATLDQLFASKKAIFGEAPPRSHSQDSKYGRRIAAVVNAMQAIKTGTMQQKFQQAVADLFDADESPAPKSAPKNGNLAARRTETDDQAWVDGVLARPTHRDTPNEPNGRYKAMKGVAQKLREKGLVNDYSPTNEHDDLPD